MGEVPLVAGEQDGIVRQDEAGDFQIHRADADALTAETGEQVSGVIVPRAPDPFGKRFDLPPQFGVGSDLAVEIAVPTTSASQPRLCSSTVMMVRSVSFRAACSRGARRWPAARLRSNSEKWSGSRTSNLFYVSLLFAILAPSRVACSKSGLS